MWEEAKGSIRVDPYAYFSNYALSLARTCLYFGQSVLFSQIFEQKSP